jgi:PST family polysaccharide transporter
VLKKLRLNPSDIFDNDFQKNELKTTVVKGGFALIISQGTSFALSMISAVVLARLLTPYDFGIIGMVTVFLNFLFIFKDIGLAHATIQKDEINNSQISTLFWINGIISISLGVILVASSPLVAMFYEQPELIAVMSALSIPFILEGFAIQHNALLRRHFKFTTLAVIDITSRIIHLVVAIVMAVLGYSYWSLVGGSIARSVVLLLLTYATCPWMPGRIKRGAGVRGMLKFGGHVTVGHFMAYLASNLDKILIGKFMGAAQLGLYNKAHHLLIVPLSQIKLPLTNLSLPVLSSLKHEPARYQSYFNKLLDISISVALPLCIYSFIESEFLILLILGPQWVEAGQIFKILAVGGIFVSLSYLPSLVMLSHGYSKRYMQLSIATAIITSISFAIGVFFGINGIAAAFSIGSFLVLIPMYIVSFRGTPMNLGAVFQTIIWPLLSAAAAGLAIFAIIRSFSVDSIIDHLLIGLVFFIVYTGLTLLRAETRKTLKSIWVSINSKRKSDKKV